ncbi:MAG: hypothetical protein OXH06_18075, partial [Gemmatimonadetes bacterium]|nr:hypothetical protein [Gemmatimonadota bacterium]
MMQNTTGVYNAVSILALDFEKHSNSTEKSLRENMLSLAIPIVILGFYGIEIGLKALLEGQGCKYDHTHDLGGLYKSLSSETNKILEGKIIEPHERFSLERFLDYHQASFVDWRYRWEKEEASLALFSPSAILMVLKGIMDTVAELHQDELVNNRPPEPDS